jgi:hypothetical protein
MPPNTSNLWWKFALALIAIHVTALFLVGWLERPLGLERLQLGQEIVTATYFLPLWFFWRNVVHAPVLHFGPDIAPWAIPTFLGWILVVLSWVLLYLIVGYLLAVIVSGFKKTD